MIWNDVDVSTTILLYHLNICYGYVYLTFFFVFVFESRNVCKAIKHVNKITTLLHPSAHMQDLG